MTETPQERLNWFVDSHMRASKAVGVEANHEEVRTGMARLLEIADHDAPSAPDTDGKTGAEVEELKRSQGPEALAEKLGGEFFYGNEREEPLIEKPKPAAKAPSGLDGEKHFALLNRIKILMRRMPGYKLKPTESIYAAFEFPWFAQLLDQNTQHAALNAPGPVGKGKYSGLSQADRQRRYYRRLEQICDQSNFVIGRGWWVPR